jgi:hypothetical protein
MAYEELLTAPSLLVNKKLIQREEAGFSSRFLLDFVNLQI